MTEVKASGAVIQENGGDSRESLRRLFHGRPLTPVHRRIASFLTGQPPGEVPFLSINDIAAGAGVSQPSVSRFALALGFAGINEFREALRASAFEGVSKGREVKDLHPYQSLINDEIQNLEHLRESVADGSAIRTVAKDLTHSTPLPVVGLRISAPLAQLFAGFASKVLPDVRLLTAGGSQLEEAIDVARRDGATAILFYAMPRYPREVLEAMHWARQCGLKVILATDGRYSTLAEAADVVLVTDLSKSFTFHSYSAPVTLTMLILEAIVDGLEGAEAGRLDAFDDLAQERKFFVP